MVIYQVSNLYQAAEAQWVFKDIVNKLYKLGVCIVLFFSIKFDHRAYRRCSVYILLYHTIYRLQRNNSILGDCLSSSDLLLLSHGKCNTAN